LAVAAGVVALLAMSLSWGGPSHAKGKTIAKRTESEPQAAGSEADPLADLAEPEPAKPKKPAPIAKTTLEIDLTGCDLGEVSVSVDGVELADAGGGNPRWEGPPGTHSLCILRRGYEPIEQFLPLEAGQARRFTPEWKAVPVPELPAAPEPSQTAHQFDDWFQDFEEAKAAAAKGEKCVLLLFDGSDWCPYCAQLAEEVLRQPEFLEKAKEKYEMVYVDFPHGDAGRAQVKDPARNARLAQGFHVKGFPTIIASDEAGHVIGVQEGMRPGGVGPFLDAMEQWRAASAQIKELLGAIAAAQGPERAEAINRARKFLDERGLTEFYRAELEEWSAPLAPSHDAPPAQDEPAPGRSKPKEPPRGKRTG